jgi:hypothetical protein
MEVVNNKGMFLLRVERARHDDACECKKDTRYCPLRGSNTRSLDYKSSALPLGQGGDFNGL